MKALKKLGKYMPKHKKDDVEQKYKIGKELGSGNFAVVKVATHKESGGKYAVKIIDKKLCAGKEEMIETEVDILRRVEHKNIVCMKEMFDTPEKLYLVLELVEGGELFDRIVEEGSFTERDASRIMKQMVEAIRYLHEKEIVHRDLKPENLLFRTSEPNADIMLADFGLSKLVSDNIALSTACGTPNYVAPEILRQQGYGKPVDIWSLGVICYILLCGYPPFHDDNDAVLFQKIMKGDYEFNPQYWGSISDSAKDLIKKMLVVDPSQRLDADKCLEHPWISGKTATDVDIHDTVATSLRAFNARRTFKKAVHTINTVNKLKRMSIADKTDKAKEGEAGSSEKKE
eukprot:Nk52_evm39s32 gene=Nk52_evmTU39s32